MADVLMQAVLDAEIVIVVIVPDWIRVPDQWGRRRIDQQDDWVRQELIAALDASGKRVIPVLVRGAKLPPSDALPEQVRPFKVPSLLA